MISSWKKSPVFKWMTFFCFLLIISPVVFVVLIKYGISGPLPDDSALKEIKSIEASEVLDAEGNLLGKYFIIDRKPITLSEISKEAVNALIATEDIRFYKHNGIDRKSLLRVFFKTILLQEERSGGGSTITQQLIKNLMPRKTYTFFSTPVNKVREMLIALHFEKLYSKDEILTLYLNTVPFGENVYGIEAASQRYFSKTALTLQAHEAACLIGMLKATTAYNPRLHPERALVRRNTVLSLMQKHAFIDEDEYITFKNMPLGLNYSSLSSNDGLAPYFRSYLVSHIKNLLADHENQNHSTYNLFTSGLKVYTTIDSRMQSIAESAMAQHMRSLQSIFDRHWSQSKPWQTNPAILQRAIQNSDVYKQYINNGLSHDDCIQKMQVKKNMEIFTWQGTKQSNLSSIDSIMHYLMFLQVGLVALEPTSGHIKVWVGGINHQFFKYDHVNAKTRRQVGSTFKPILYASALEQGVSPCEYFDAMQETYTENGKAWTPSNSDGNHEGHYTMLTAMANSMNTISAKLIQQTGIDGAIETARNLGINNPIPYVPSIALGTASLSLVEMANAYTAFINEGRITDPIFILKIEDRYGNVIWEKPKSTYHQAISIQTSKIILEMLKKVVEEGTAQRLRSQYNIWADMAGKTGTTQNNADGWFIGILPDLVCGVWVGADDPSIHFRTTSLGQGANTALPIFAHFMKQYDPHQRWIFPPVDPEIADLLDCEAFTDPDQNILERLLNSKTFQILKKNKEPKEKKRRFWQRNKDKRDN